VYGTRLIVSIIINIVLSGTISVAFAAYRLPPPLPAESCRSTQRRGDIRWRLYEAAMFLRYHLLYFHPFFFYFEHWSRWCGEGSSRARARAYMHARTRMRARDIPSPSFARGSLHGAQALQGSDEKDDDVSRAVFFHSSSLSFLAHFGFSHISSVFCDIVNGRRNAPDSALSS